MGGNIRTRQARSAVGEAAWVKGRAGELMEAAMEGRSGDVGKLGASGASLAGLSSAS